MSMLRESVLALRLKMRGQQLHCPIYKMHSNYTNIQLTHRIQLTDVTKMTNKMIINRIKSKTSPQQVLLLIEMAIANGNEEATLQKFVLYLEEGLAEFQVQGMNQIKKSKDKRLAKKIKLMTDEGEEVVVKYNIYLQLLKIKCGKDKAVICYYDLTYHVRDYYLNPLDLYSTLKKMNHKIHYNPQSKSLTFSDKRINWRAIPRVPKERHDDQKVILIIANIVEDIQKQIEILKLVRGKASNLLPDKYLELGLTYQRFKIYDKDLQNQYFDLAEQKIIEAINIYSKLGLEGTDKYAQAHHKFGLFYLQRNKRQQQRNKRQEQDNSYCYARKSLTEYEKKAIDLFQIAQRQLIQAKTSNFILLASALNFLGEIRIPFDKEIALGYLQQGLKILKDYGDEASFTIRLNLGKLHNRYNQYSSSLTNLQICLEVLKFRQDNGPDLYDTLDELQKAYLGLNQYKQGLKIVQQLDIYCQQKSPSRREQLEKVRSQWSIRLLSLYPHQAYDIIKLLKEYHRILKNSGFGHIMPRLFAIEKRLDQLN